MLENFWIIPVMFLIGMILVVISQRILKTNIKQKEKIEKIFGSIGSILIFAAILSFVSLFLTEAFPER